MRGARGWACIASSKSFVPSTLISLAQSGRSSLLVPVAESLGMTKARWMTASTPSTARATSSRSRRSPQTTSQASSTAKRRATLWLVGVETSKARTRWPRRSSSSRVWAPILPKAPVSRTCMSRLLGDAAQQHRGTLGDDAPPIAVAGVQQTLQQGAQGKRHEDSGAGGRVVPAQGPLADTAIEQVLQPVVVTPIGRPCHSRQVDIARRLVPQLEEQTARAVRPGEGRPRGGGSRE